MGGDCIVCICSYCFLGVVVLHFQLGLEIEFVSRLVGFCSAWRVHEWCLVCSEGIKQCGFGHTYVLL